MKSYVTKHPVREVNRKLFANDIIYDGNRLEILDTVIANIIQQYNPDNELAGVPNIIEIKNALLNKEIVDKIKLLNSNSILIQINSSALASNEKADIIKEIKENGYKVIIEINKDDTVFTLAKILADIVKFDIQNLPEGIIKGTTGFTCKKLAYNVNSPEDFVVAENSGIDYYEGEYIAPATNVQVRSIGYSKVNFIEIINNINNNDIDLNKVARLIARDTLLSAQIIRLSNSIYFRNGTRTESIERAVFNIGKNNLKRWIFLMEFSNNANVSEELLQMSYHRAIFCERIIKESRKKDITTSEAYIIGLFSMIDVLSGHPMDIEISKMRLSDAVEKALIYRDGIGGKLINLVKAYEDANWDYVDEYLDTFNLFENEMCEIYYESINDAAQVWKNMTEHGSVK